MSGIIEEFWNEAKREGITEANKAVAFRMLAAGKYSLEEIANITGLAIAEIKELQNEKYKF